MSFPTLSARRNPIPVSLGKNEGQCVVDLCELGKNLRCSKCKNVLDLENVVAEKKCGLHSILSIVCNKSNITSVVHTGKIRKFDDGHPYAQSNLTAVLGKFHHKMIKFILSLEAVH